MLKLKVVEQKSTSNLQNIAAAYLDAANRLMFESHNQELATKYHEEITKGLREYGQELLKLEEYKPDVPMEYSTTQFTHDPEVSFMGRVMHEYYLICNFKIGDLYLLSFKFRLWRNPIDPNEHGFETVVNKFVTRLDTTHTVSKIVDRVMTNA